MKQFIALFILFAASCAHAPAGAPAAAWLQYESAEEAGYDSDALAAARAYAEQLQSAAVVVVADGRVVASWGAVDRKLELHSVRKSIYSALWGIAESRGLVKLEATLEELGVDDKSPLTAQEKKARLVDLLRARSGVYHRSAYSPSDMEEGLPARGSHPPDTHWFYNNWDFNVSGALLETVTGKPLGTLIDEWIARPLGMEDLRAEDVFAMREPGVSRWPALTIRMSARDLARFGQLWLDSGRWNGRAIVPSDWIARASAPASNTGSPGQGYGMMWWTYDAGSVDAQRYPNASRVRLLLGRGTGGQVVAIIPEARLVIVHRADTDNGRHVGGRDVWTLIDRILGARRGETRTASPRLTAVRTEPFASQLSPFAWPEPVIPSAESLGALVGDYEFRPGVAARVFLDDGRLFAFMPGHGEAELFAASNDDFFVRVDPTARIHFVRDAAGAPSGVRVSIAGREMTGRKK